MVANKAFAGTVAYDFTGKTVVIFGGTTGIGRATAKDFAKAGAKVFVSGLGEADGKSLVEEIKSAGNANVEFVEANVTRDADISKVMEKTIARFGGFTSPSTTPAFPGLTSQCTR